MFFLKKDKCMYFELEAWYGQGRIAMLTNASVKYGVLERHLEECD